MWKKIKNNLLGLTALIFFGALIICYAFVLLVNTFGLYTLMVIPLFGLLVISYGIAVILRERFNRNEN